MESSHKENKKTNSPVNNLKIIYTNADSLINKRCELNQLAADREPDIICVTEILPKNSTSDVQQSEFCLDGYNCFTNIGKQNSKRGVAIYVKKSLKSTSIDNDPSFIESTWCEVSINDNTEKLVIAGVYRSPNSTNENNLALNKAILERTVNQKYVLIMGDFNHPEIKWNGSNGRTHVDENHKAYRFLDTVRDAFLFQHVIEPTHFRGLQTPNTLDLILTVEEGMVSNLIHHAPIGKSHHAVLSFDFICHTDSNINANTEIQYNYTKGDYESIKQKFENIDWKNRLMSKNLDEAWYLLESELKSSVENHVPSKKISKKKQNMWLNRSVLAKLRKKQKAYQLFLKTKDGRDYLAYTRSRNQAKWECRKAKKLFEKSLAKEVKNNPKAFYSYAKSKMKTESTIPDLLNESNEKTQNDQEKAELLADHFTNMFTRENSNDLPTFTSKIVNNKLTSIKITTEMINEKLKKLNVSKSSGPDKIHPRLLYELSDQLALPLSIIFNKSINEGKIPKTWKDAEITPLYKKGKRNIPSNYRPISLTSVVCKLLESIIRDNILKHLTDNNLVQQSQHGFVPKRSCFTNLLHMLETWTSALDKGICIDAIYLDFSKAFDSVPHKRLLLKLKGYGIQEQLLSWITDFLSDRRQRVKVNGSYSSWHNVLSGVPQGSVLGPILFVIFINDMPENLVSHLLMFADDAKVFRLLQSGNDCVILREDLSKLDSWSKEWCMQFNINKCKVMHLGSNNENENYYLSTNLNEQLLLKKSENEKDLGVVIEPNLCFTLRTETQVNKANQILGMIRRTFDYLDLPTFKTLFTTLVRPHLEYCFSACAPLYLKDKRLLESVLRRATAMLPGLKQFSYSERLFVIGLPSMRYRQERGDMIQVFKLLNNFYDIDTQQIIPLQHQGLSTRGHPFKLKKQHSRLNVRKNFFTNRVVDQWNSLPTETVISPSLNAFKNNLDKNWAERMFIFY